jgi:hypothetical protein
MKKHNKYSILGLKALHRAAAKVAEEAKKNNYKIPVWLNGKIEFELPEIIAENFNSTDKTTSAHILNDLSGKS